MWLSLAREFFGILWKLNKAVDEAFILHFSAFDILNVLTSYYNEPPIFTRAKFTFDLYNLIHFFKNVNIIFQPKSKL